MFIHFEPSLKYGVISLVGGYARNFQTLKTASQYFVNISEGKVKQLLQEFGKEFRLIIKADTAQAIEDNNRIVCDLLRQEIRASAHGVKSELRQEMHLVKDELRQEMRLMKQETVCGIVEVIDEGVLPEIAALDRRVTVLEAKISAA